MGFRRGVSNWNFWEERYIIINSFEFRVCMCGRGRLKGVSNEKLEPCSKSTGVTLLEMTQLLVGNTAFSIMEVTWRKGFALLPDRNFHPFRWRESSARSGSLSLSIFSSIKQSIPHRWIPAFYFVRTLAKRRCTAYTFSFTLLLIGEEKIGNAPASTRKVSPNSSHCHEN